MKKTGLFFAIVLFFIFACGLVFAADENAAQTTPRQEIKGDIQNLRQEKQEISQDAKAAHNEEKALREQIHKAVQAGDFEKAQALEEQLKQTHQENIDQMQQNKQELQDMRQELKQDLKEEGIKPRLQNPPGYNPPGVGPKNPPGYNPPGTGPKPMTPGINDRVEDIRDHREDVRDRREDRRDIREDVKDRREDVRDRREDIRDRREDKWDAAHNPPPGTEGYRRDKLEDIRDRREDVKDRREDIGDRRENVRDRREDVRDRREDRRDVREDVRDKSTGEAGRGSLHQGRDLRNSIDRREDVRDNRKGMGKKPAQSGKGRQR